MGRPRKVNKVPMTTVALSDGLIQEMVKSKKSCETWYDLINRVFREWKVLRSEYTRLLDESNKLEEDLRKDYEAQVEFWKKKANKKELTV